MKVGREWWKPREQRRRRIYCNHCARSTNHVVAGQHKRVIDLGEGRIETTISALWICAGCEAGTLEISWTETGLRRGTRRLYTTSLHPTRTEEHLESKPIIGVPRKLTDLYEESIGAFNSGLPILCAAGIRALVEAICANKKIPGRSLEQKIESLAALLPASIVKNLHRLRFMGNRAMHELAAPDEETLKLSVEVVEDLLTFFYALQRKTTFLPKGPRRVRRN